MGNIIPTTTGAEKAIKTVLPKLAGKVSGISVWVPTANVSMVDLTVETVQSTSLDELMIEFRTPAQQELSGILQVEDEELASVELKLNIFKIIAWYDNEWAYCCRLLDMLVFMNSQG
ncbi:uncharacterized protein EAF02_001938 [Botrytis sinoallii]|uniref:uncharacterized protein n=1 Tax=Botrytis sinoallii TaxID=1463999 RepID=UPI00190031BA|nr:uncharacterized protein EAF02_001938 [Botrytis sinoallii]KAF7889523.1 hypothetical protein EAF02_001938 [Botrytis sinoallii]